MPLRKGERTLVAGVFGGSAQLRAHVVWTFCQQAEAQHAVGASAWRQDEEERQLLVVAELGLDGMFDDTTQHRRHRGRPCGLRARHLRHADEESGRREGGKPAHST